MIRLNKETSDQMNITFKLETTTDLTEISIPLMESHFNEISHLADLGHKFEPNIEAYNRYCQMDIVKCFSAYDDNKIVGYAV